DTIIPIRADARFVHPNSQSYFDPRFLDRPRERRPQGAQVPLRGDPCALVHHPTQLLPLVKEGNAMSSLGGHERRLESRRASTDDGHVLGVRSAAYRSKSDNEGVYVTLRRIA